MRSSWADKAHGTPGTWDTLCKFAIFYCHLRYSVIKSWGSWTPLKSFQFSSVAQSCPALCEPKTAARQASLSVTNTRDGDSCPLSQWCHPTISSSVVPCSSHLQSFPASGSFIVSQFFASGGQSIGVSASASVLPMNIQDWFPLGWRVLGRGTDRFRFVA